MMQTDVLVSAVLSSDGQFTNAAGTSDIFNRKILWLIQYKFKH